MNQLFEEDELLFFYTETINPLNLNLHYLIKEDHIVLGSRIKCLFI